MKRFTGKPTGRVGRTEYWNTKADKPPLTGPVDPTRPVGVTPRHPGGAPSVFELSQLKPDANMVRDPMLDWGHALEKFQSFQIGSGFDLLKDKKQIDNAQDLVQVQAAQSVMQPGSSLADYDAQFFADQPWHTNPNPSSAPQPAGPMDPAPQIDPMTPSEQSDPMASNPILDLMKPNSDSGR